MPNRNADPINNYTYSEVATFKVMAGKKWRELTYRQTFVNLRTPNGVVIRRNLSIAKQHVQVLLKKGYTLTLENVTVRV